MASVKCRPFCSCLTMLCWPLYSAAACIVSFKWRIVSMTARAVGLISRDCFRASHYSLWILNQDLPLILIIYHISVHYISHTQIFYHRLINDNINKFTSMAIWFILWSKQINIWIGQNQHNANCIMNYVINHISYYWYYNNWLVNIFIRSCISEHLNKPCNALCCRYKTPWRNPVSYYFVSEC